MRLALAWTALHCATAAFLTPDWLINPINTPATVTKGINNTLILSNGLISRTFSLAPFYTLDYYSFQTDSSLLRAIGPEAIVTLDNITYNIGDAVQDPNMPGYSGYLNRSALNVFTNASAWTMVDYTVGVPSAQFNWTAGTRGSPTTAKWPPVGATLSVTFQAPATAPLKHQDISITIVYEMYQGSPMMTKWLIINSTGPYSAGVLINSTIIEYLMVNTPYSPLSFSPYPPSTVQSDVTSLLFVETDQAHSTVVSWQDDPNVGAMPGAGEPLLNVTYSLGPGVVLQGAGDVDSLLFNQEEIKCEATSCVHVHPESGERIPLGSRFQNVRHRRIHHGAHFRPQLYHTRLGMEVAEFVSFRTIEMVHESTDIERIGLCVRKIWRILAPWVQENPLFLHAANTTNAGWQLEADQVADVGFEMMIYSFGTSFSPETFNETIIEYYAEQVAYSKSKGIEVGGYDLIVLDRGDVGPNFLVVNPDMQFGGDACIASGWYNNLTLYFTNFHEQVGLTMYETDGPYYEDTCSADNHTYHMGYEDSVYHQAMMQNQFFAWLKGMNIFINAPDMYHFAGSNKVGYGYNEDQYSLPRLQDIAITRAGMYTQTFRLVPSMGWGVAPLIDYHGGGDSASFYPFAQNLADYDYLLALYMSTGIAACWRGDSLYDTNTTRAVVVKWVQFYKQYRQILISDIIHIRRADMQGIDAFMHANAFIEDRGMAFVFNPTDFSASKQVSLPLYYTGISNFANVSTLGGAFVTYPVARDYSVTVQVTLPPRTYTWFLIHSAD